MVYIILFLFTDSKTWNSSLLEDLATDEPRIFGAAAQLHWSPNGQKRIPRPYDSSLNPVASRRSNSARDFQRHFKRLHQDEVRQSERQCCRSHFVHFVCASDFTKSLLRSAWGTLPWSGHCKESSTMGIRYQNRHLNGCYKRFSIGFPTLTLIYNYPLVI